MINLLNVRLINRKVIVFLIRILLYIKICIYVRVPTSFSCTYTYI